MRSSEFTPQTHCSVAFCSTAVLQRCSGLRAALRSVFQQLNADKRRARIIFACFEVSRARASGPSGQSKQPALIELCFVDTCYAQRGTRSGSRNLFAPCPRRPTSRCRRAPDGVFDHWTKCLRTCRCVPYNPSELATCMCQCASSPALPEAARCKHAHRRPSYTPYFQAKQRQCRSPLLRRYEAGTVGSRTRRSCAKPPLSLRPPARRPALSSAHSQPRASHRALQSRTNPPAAPST